MTAPYQILPHLRLALPGVLTAIELPTRARRLSYQEVRLSEIQHTESHTSRITASVPDGTGRRYASYVVSWHQLVHASELIYLARHVAEGLAFALYDTIEPGWKEALKQQRKDEHESRRALLQSYPGSWVEYNKFDTQFTLDAYVMQAQKLARTGRMSTNDPALQRVPDKKETTTMDIAKTTEQGDFTLVTIAIPTADVSEIRSVDPLARTQSNAIARLVNLVAAELPAVVELTEGMRYQYDGASNYIYEVTQVGEKEVVLRRHTANSRGGKGSRLVETRAKAEQDLRDGRATVMVDEVSQ